MTKSRRSIISDLSFTPEHFAYDSETRRAKHGHARSCFVFQDLMSTQGAAPPSVGQALRSSGGAYTARTSDDSMAQGCPGRVGLAYQLGPFGPGEAIAPLHVREQQQAAVVDHPLLRVRLDLAAGRNGIGAIACILRCIAIRI